LVEAEGMRRAHRAMEKADQVLLIIDASEGTAAETWPDSLPDGASLTVVRNKIDLTGEAAHRADREGVTVISVSALTGAGIDLLRAHLQELMGYQAAGEGAFSARRRHLDALRRARAHLEEAVTQLRTFRAGELVAEELRLAQQELGSITGEVSSDDLLGEIFSSFCIGK